MTSQTDLYYRAVKFLNDEARLLDERRFREWLDLFTEDAHYWMPVRTTTAGPARAQAPSAGSSNGVVDELAGEGELALYDDTKESLTRRVDRLETGMAWAEQPPSRTRHFVSNVDVEPTSDESELLVRSNFILYRQRLESIQDTFMGTREDVIRTESDRWRIARRKIILDQNVIDSMNLSVFF